MRVKRLIFLTSNEPPLPVTNSQTALTDSHIRSHIGLIFRYGVARLGWSQTAKCDVRVGAVSNVV